MEPASAPRFAAAGQPDVVLAAQKDAYHAHKARERFLGAFDAVLEPYQAVAVMPEVKLLADVVYFAMTTARGRQTLGEEYCDVLPVVEKGKSWATPTAAHKAALLVFGVLAPYAAKRIENGGWKSLAVLFQKPLTAAERAAEMRRRMLERARQQQTQSPASGAAPGAGAQIDVDAPRAALSERAKAFWARHREHILWILGWSELMYKVHLAVFYLRGTFYEVSKRLSGYHLVFTREPQSDRPSYRILGWFLLAQLAIEAAPAVKQSVRSVLFAWGFLAHKRPKGKGAKKSDSPADDDDDESLRDADEVVPSLPTAETAAQDLEDLDLVVLRDKNHERGMEHIKCGICLSPVENGACPPCGHMYCYEHIAEAVAVKSECPLCRQACEPSDIMCVYYTL